LTDAQEDTWESAPLRPKPEDRRAEIIRLGLEWTKTDKDKIPTDYIDQLQTVRDTFGTKAAIESATKEAFTQGFVSVHAFAEQSRFVKRGGSNLRDAFWASNDQNVAKVKRTMLYLIHGGGEFVPRLHDVLYEPARKLAYFGRFCALELYGTVKPEDYPPINGRMAKALRFLGFDVRGV
jgi:hypothetical protein